MKYIIVLIIGLNWCHLAQGQEKEEVSMIDFVQVLNGNREEALFYYKNNWQVLREMAKERGYIRSFRILEMEASEEAPFQLMLITTYANKQQYAASEAHFAALIKEKGSLELLNDKKPGAFRKVLFHKGEVKTLN